MCSIACTCDALSATVETWFEAFYEFSKDTACVGVSVWMCVRFFNALAHLYMHIITNKLQKMENP